MKILIVNPNSSSPITEALQVSTSCPPGCTLDFFTGPTDSAPPSIDDEQTSEQSHRACLPLLDVLVKDFDGIVIACYSVHPLVQSLKRSHPDKSIVGILEASVIHALLLGKRFGIVTTGEAWERVLAAGVASFRFVGVASTGLGVNELHSAGVNEVAQRMGDASKTLVERGADVICLGCAGMSGMDMTVRSATRGSPVVVVDGVQAGVELIASLGRRKPSYNE